MKNQYKVLSGIMILIGCMISSTRAQSLGELIDTLWTSAAFWYSTEKPVTVKKILPNNIITIESPLIRDEAGDPITSYTVMYSKYPLTEVLDKTDLLNEGKTVDFELTGSANPFTMDITIDNAITGAIYYLFVIPKKSKTILGELSNELRVNLGSKTSWNAWDNTAPETHGVASTEPDLKLAHISHTLNGNNITLTWSDIEISKTLEIDVMEPGKSTFSNIAKIKMSDEKYVYTANKNGEYIFRFRAIDCGKQINYTVTLQWAKEQTGTKTGIITKVPKTGPAENTIAIVLLSALLYLGYSKIYRKAK